jgi:anti-sigma regulatory factor (Ser/Thr protein kinase)
LTLAQPFAVDVRDVSHVSSARLQVARMSQALGFDSTRAGRAAIVVTEAVGNMVKHASGGTFAARAVSRNGAVGVELLAIDSGPGMRDLAASSADGHSTSGTPGTGLGAMRRQADEFDVYTRAGSGTILRALIWAAAVPVESENYDVGALCIPKPGETVCGDAWGMTVDPRGATFLLADGLGHGPDAGLAATAAVDVLCRNVAASPIRILDLAHARLRPTRGAAVAVIRHVAGGDIAFAGVGNIGACVVDAGNRRAMVSHNGIVGHNVHKSQEFAYAWPRGALLIAYTDGIETQWDLGMHPGLLDCHPAIVAAMLYRQHARGRDDVGIVVARNRH